MHINWVLRLAAVCSIVVTSLGLVNRARAELFTVYDRFGPGDSWNGSFGADVGSPPANYNHDEDVANGFVVPATHTSVTLAAVEVAFFNPSNNSGDSDVTLTLHDDVAGEPGSVLETFNFTLAPPVSSGIYLLNSVTNPALSAGAQYWLVASASGVGSEMSWSWNGVDPWATANGPVVRSVDAGIWQDTSAYGQQAFRITANGIAVPEPSTLALATIALIAMALPYARRGAPGRLHQG